MLFTEFLDSVANTEDEARFFEELDKVMEHLEQATNIPVVGKLIKAIAVLGELRSIEAFKETEHYQSIEGWDIYVDLDKGLLSIYPGAEQRKKIFTVMACIAAGIFLLWLCIKCCRKKMK